MRVEKPLLTHYEWVTCMNTGNYSAIKKLLDPTVSSHDPYPKLIPYMPNPHTYVPANPYTHTHQVSYYCILYQYLPESKAAPKFIARKFVGQNAVFERLDNEMSRQAGNIHIISSTLSGEKLRDLRARRALTADQDNKTLCNNDARVPAEQVPRQARQSSARQSSSQLPFPQPHSHPHLIPAPRHPLRARPSSSAFTLALR